MSVFSAAAGNFRMRADAGDENAGWSGRFWEGGDFGRSVAGKTVTQQTAQTISAFYCASYLLATLIATLPLGMYSMDPQNPDEWNVDHLHPLNRLFQISPYPARNLMPYNWIVQIVFRLIFRGNYYAKIVNSRDLGTTAIIPINPDACHPFLLSDGTIALKCNDTQAGIVGTLVPGEYIHIKGETLRYDDLAGVSVITHAAASLGHTLAVDQYGQLMFENGARPSGLITMPPGTDEDVYQKWRARIRQQNSGPRNAHKTLILTDGATFSPISMNNVDVQLLELRNFQVEEVCRWLNVPPVLLHHTAPSTSFGTGIEQQILAFTRFSLDPWLKKIAQALRFFLCTNQLMEKPKFDTTLLERGDSAAVIGFYSRAVLSKILTPNEARAALGYSAEEWGRDPLQPVAQIDMPADGSQPPPVKQQIPPGQTAPLPTNQPAKPGK